MTLSVAQAAAELGLSVQRVRALIAEGRLKATKLGERAYMIDSKALAAVRVRKTGRPKR